MANHENDRMRKWAKKAAQRTRSDICAISGKEQEWLRRMARREQFLRDYQKMQKNGGKGPVTEERLAALLEMRRRRQSCAALGRDADSDGEHRYGGADR